jgi:hypothetical protein
LGKLAISFKVPAPTTNQARHRAFLSSGAQSVSVTVNGGTATIVNLTNCSASADNLSKVCPIVGVTAPAGTDTVVVSAYDGNNAGGSLLGSGSVTSSVTAGQTTPVSISLDGQPSSVDLQLSNSVPPTGTSAALSLSVAAHDAQGYYIVGPYLTPISITDNDTSSEVTLSKTTLTGSSDSITVTYSGTGSNAVTFTGTISGTSTTGTVALTPGGSFGELVVDNYEDGTPYCGVDVYNASLTGSIQPVAKDRGTNENNDCGVDAIAPGGDPVLSGENGTYGWYAYGGQSTTSYQFLSLVNATGIHFDKSGHLFADERSNAGISIVEFSAPLQDNVYPAKTIDLPQSATIGNPITTIEQSKTDPSGNLWYPGVDGIDEFSIVNGPSTELNHISYGGLQSLYDFEFGPSGEIWICDQTANQVVKLAPGATTASSPANVITGTYVNGCEYVQVDSMGEVYVLVANNTINVFPSTATGNATPTRSLQLNSGYASSQFALQY